MSDLLELARSVLSGLSSETSESSEQSSVATALPSPSSLLSRPRRSLSHRRRVRRRRTPRVPCFTCSLSPTGTHKDGSPRYDHGHDTVTGEVWWRSRHEQAAARLCPACHHEHPVPTTCRQCPACRAGDLTDIARDMFADLLPGGADWQAALLRHNHNLGRDAACDGSCGLADCGRPYFDRAGLTRRRDGSTRCEQLVTASTELIILPIEDDYPRSASEVVR